MSEVTELFGAIDALQTQGCLEHATCTQDLLSVFVAARHICSRLVQLERQLGSVAAVEDDIWIDSVVSRFV